MGLVSFQWRGKSRLLLNRIAKELNQYADANAFGWGLS